MKKGVKKGVNNGVNNGVKRSVKRSVKRTVKNTVKKTVKNNVSVLDSRSIHAVIHVPSRRRLPPPLRYSRGSGAFHAFVKHYCPLERLVDTMTDSLSRFKPLLRSLFGRGTLENEMQAEMRDHMERATQRLIDRGMSPHDARLEARREFGNVAALQEDARDARGPRWLEALAGDTRFALRYFARRRATATIIVAVLALGTGANTLMFSMFQAQFLRPAPAVEHDGRVARIWTQERANRTAAWNRRGFTYPELRALADRRDVFEDVAAFASQDVIVGGRDGSEARAVRAQFVTPNYFALMGVPLAAGAGFPRQSSDATDLRSAVLSHALATKLFSDPAAAVGRAILVNEVPLTVVGVAPPKFQGAARKMAASVWIPLGGRAEIAGVPPQWASQSSILQSFARLAVNASREEATELARRTVIGNLPDSAGRVGMSRTADVLSMLAIPPGPDRMETIVQSVMFGTIGALILLVGWMNVSSLMVAAAIARRQEIAVRLSLGASRLRILRQLVTESTLLAAGGGAVGLGLAWAALTVFANIGVGGIEIMPDGATFVFAIAISVVTGILFGLSPALHATRGTVGTAIRDSGAGSTSQSRLQRTFVTAQIALSQPLLVLLGSLLWMLSVGYDTKAPDVSSRIIVVNTYAVPRNGRDGSTVENLDSLYARIARHPEVVAVAPEAMMFEKGLVRTTPGTPGTDETGQRTVTLQGIVPGWLRMADLPLLLGRDVSLVDTAGTAAIPVVIGNNLARAMWGDANPIGRTLGAPRLHDMDDPNMVLSVVGVYDASRGVPTISAGGTGATDPDGPFRVFTARGKHWRSDMILVRTRGVADPFINDLRQLIRTAAPSLPIEFVRTLSQIEADANAEFVQGAVLAAAGGAIALLLTSLGLYGVVSLAVQQRTREIGVRIAIGANPAAVKRLFVRSGVRIAVIALLIGLPVTLAGLRVGQAQGVVPEEGPNFWLVGLGVSIALLAVASAATWGPARRASLVDPAIALRAE